MLGVVVDMSAVHAEPLTLQLDAARQFDFFLGEWDCSWDDGDRRHVAHQLGLPRPRRQGRRRELRRPPLARLPGAQLLGLRPERRVLEADVGGQRGQLSRLRRLLRERRHGAAAERRARRRSRDLPDALGEHRARVARLVVAALRRRRRDLDVRSGRSSTAVSYSWVDPHFAALYARREEERLVERLASRLARASRLRAEPRRDRLARSRLGRAGHPAARPPSPALGTN